MSDTEIVGRIERTKEHPERFSLLRADGSLSNHFGQDESREDVAVILRQNGMILRDDNMVVKA